MLELNHVSKKYGKTLVIRDFSLKIGHGEVICLRGSNGAGKTTLMAMIAGILKPDGGNILYEGLDIFKNKKEYRKKIGYVPQSGAIYEELSGMDNLKYWGSIQGLKGGTLKNQIEKVLEFVGLEKGDLKKKTCTYSGGMKQRVNIAAALLGQPKLLLLDEPTAGIDEKSRKRLSKALGALNSYGTAILYTGHYRDELEELGGRWVDLDTQSQTAFQAGQTTGGKS